MAAPLSSIHRGWFWDKENSTLDLYFGVGGASDPTEIMQVNASGITHLLAETFNADLIFGDGVGVILGSTTAVTISDGDGATNLTPEMQVLGTAAADGSILAASFNTTNTRAVAPHIALVKGAAATQVATTAVADNEVVGSIIAYGSDGVDFETPVAAIEFVVDDVGAPGTGAIGGSLEFYTTADGGETLTLAFTVNSDQNIYVANNNGIIIGHTVQINTGVIPEFQILGTTKADASMLIHLGAADAVGPEIQFVKSRGAIGTPTIVADNDVAGRVVWLPTDGADYATEAAMFFAEVDDGTPATGDIGMAFVWQSMPGAGGAIREVMRLSAAADLSVLGGRSIMANSATEIGFNTTSSALTVGSEGSMVAPYLSSTDPAFTDAVGGNLDGCFGFQRDSDAGPIVTLEARVEGAWLSVAISGTLFPAKREYEPTPNYLVHPAQVFAADDKQWVDESRCFVCGEAMQAGEQVVFYANSRRKNGDLHAIYGHPHPERMGYVAGLEERIKKLEAMLQTKKEKAA